MDHRTDHDLLIELNKTVELLFAEQQRMMQSHMNEDTEQFAAISLKLTAAHQRLDRLGSIKDKVLGGTCVIMFFFSAIISILSIIRP